MINLIKNELTKIFKKKSIYITLIVILGFVILTNCIYKFFYNDTMSYGYSENYVKYLKEDLAKLDPSKASDISMYIDLKSQLDTFEIIEKYDEDSWQRQIASTNISGYIKEKNTYQYGTEKDEEKVKKAQEKINETIDRLDKDDWKYFANTELEEAKANVENLEKQLKETRR